MKKYLKLWPIVGIMFFSCEKDEITLSEVDNPYILNECKMEGINSIRVKNSNNQDEKVLEIKVRVNGDTLVVDYVPQPGYYVNNLSYHIATNPNDIPQGENAHQNYIYKEAGRKIVISVIAKEVDFSGLLYMSAFANIGEYNFSPTDTIECAVTRADKVESKSYFIHSLKSFKTATQADTLMGQYEAFCLQGDQAMNVGAPHTVRRLSSYTADRPKLDGVIDNENNMELVNWIINQDRIRWTRADGNPANGADIQMAIWDLVETTGNPTGMHIEGLYDLNTVAKIVDDAKKSGRGFRPLCGQNELVILHKGVISGYSAVDSTFNTGSYRYPYNYQVSGIVQKIVCQAIKKVYSRGTQFNSSDPIEAPQYFAICVN